MPSRKRTDRTRDEAAEAARIVADIKATADQLLKDHADRGDIKLVARAFRELRTAFKTLSQYRNRRKVSVFGSARSRPGTPLYEHAISFGREIVKRGFMVITGAGPGIMEAGHVGAGADHSIGLNILLPFESEANKIIANDIKLVDLNYFFTRKLLFLKETDAIVLFPGGFGTLDEGFEILTLIQCGKGQMMPVVMVDVPGSHYWDHWREFIEGNLYRGGMISKQDFSLFRITHSIEEAADEISRFYRVFHSQRFVKGQLALRLQRSLSDETMRLINAEFRDILESGVFRLTKAHTHESNEPTLK